MIEWNIDVSQQSDRKLPMDIFVPESDRLRGALLFLHGGGFVGGRKEQFLGICASAALKTGWVCASLDYRLAGKAPFPAQTEDVRAAVAYLEAHAAQWRIDTNRVHRGAKRPDARNVRSNLYSAQWHCQYPCIRSPQSGRSGQGARIYAG